MRRKDIPVRVRLVLAAKAAGRCSYRGCNKALTAHQLTRTTGNFSAFAHIVADSPNGPRGDVERSKELALDESNLMLLCHECHKLIDEGDVNGHPVDLLRAMKAEHEARIARLVEVGPHTKTRLLIMSATVGDQLPAIDALEVRRGVHDRYLHGEPVRINFPLRDVKDRDADYWSLLRGETRRTLETRLRAAEDDDPAGHITVAALAPIPSLIDLGAQLGDIAHVDSRVLLRDPKSWAWDDNDQSIPDYTIGEMALASNAPAEVIVRVSVSGEAAAAPNELVKQCRAEYHLRHSAPGLDRMRTRTHRDIFRKAFGDLLHRVSAEHGNSCRIHLFAAVPNAAAVEMGRVRLPKAHPSFIVYDFNHSGGGWIRALEIGG